MQKIDFDETLVLNLSWRENAAASKKKLFRNPRFVVVITTFTLIVVCNGSVREPSVKLRSDFDASWQASRSPRSRKRRDSKITSRSIGNKENVKIMLLGAEVE